MINTHLIEPVADVVTEMVLFRDWGDSPRTEGYPTKNQIEWQKRQSPEFCAACMTKFGRDWFVHLPSLKSFLAGKRAPAAA